MEAYTIQQAKDEIKASIAVYLKKDADGRYVMREVNRLPFYLQGPPGVGKTEMASQIAKELGIGFVSLSITHHTRNTVLGLPVIRTFGEARREAGEDPVGEARGEAGEAPAGEAEAPDARYTEYTMSEMVAMVMRKVKEGYREGILLVDEFACMAESLVAPMLAFLQTKNIGNHHLPEGWVLILCSNPTAYNKTARSFDMAVMDRVRLMNITFDATEFVAYGQKRGFHSCVTEYLKLFPGDAHVCMTTESGEKIIVTTRGWENLSWCICGYEEQGRDVTQKLIRQFLKSDDVALRFYQFYLTSKSEFGMEKIGEVLEGRNLSKHIDFMKEKSYAARFQMMQLFSSVLTKECEGIGQKTELGLYLKTGSEEGVGAHSDGIQWAVNLINSRLAGQRIFRRGQERALDEQEREAWEAILRILRTEISDAGQREQGKNILARAVGIYLERERQKLLQQEQKISDKVGNACNFLAQIQGGDNLMDPFINSLNQSGGLLDVMTDVMNPIYLKYSRKAYGMDGYLKRVAENTGKAEDDDWDVECGWLADGLA